MMDKTNSMNIQRLCHVLLIYKAMIPSIRLCGHAQMMTLAEQGIIEYQATPVSKLSLRDINWADVVLIGRLDNPLELDVIKKLSNKKYLVYIIDDDLLNVPTELTGSKYYRLPQIKSSIAQIIELSDAIMSPSKVLLKKYAGVKKKQILIEEPAISDAQYKMHEKNSPIQIGFAGSVDRVGDIEVILEEVLKQLKKEYGERICYTFFGAIPSFASTLSAKVIPYTDSYEEYQQRLQASAWDIGLAPLPDTPFHCCKHYNKFIEYASAGITGVFSNCGPYTRLKEEIGIGDFCENSTDAWLETLKKLIDDYELRESKRKAAWIYAKTNLSVTSIANNLYKENVDVFQYRAPESSTSCLFQNKFFVPFAARIARIGYRLEMFIRYCFQRVLLLVRTHGWKLPLHIFRKIVLTFLFVMKNKIQEAREKKQRKHNAKM